MFGHLRPHHITVPTAGMKVEESDLENGLSNQAANAAFYRPSITAALQALSPDPPTVPSRGDNTSSGGVAPPPRGSLSGCPLPLHGRLAAAAARPDGHAESSDAEHLGSGSGAGDDDRMRPSSSASQNGRFSSPRLGRAWATGGAGPAAGSPGSVTGGGSFSGPLLTVRPDPGSPMRQGMGPGGERQGSAWPGGWGLPGVNRTSGAAVGDGAGHSPTRGPGGGGSGGGGEDMPRLPAAAMTGHTPRGNRRASVGGDVTGLPMIAASAGSMTSSAAASAAAAASVNAALGAGNSPGAASGPGKPGVGGSGRTRRSSMVAGLGNYGCGAGAGVGPSQAPTPPSGLPPHLQAGGGYERRSMPGNGMFGAGGPNVSLSGGSFTGSPGGPQLTRRPSDSGNPGIGGGGGGGGVGGSGTTASGVAPGGSQASRLGLRSSAPQEVLAGSLAGAGPGAVRHASPAVRSSFSGVPGGGGGVLDSGLLAQLADLHAGSASSISLGSGRPLNGFDSLAGTGLGDAISQLRNIRERGSITVPKEKPRKSDKEQKVEAGLAGVTPLQLLPVPLPPIENWTSSGKSNAEVDPLRGIRLVDAPMCVMPRPAAEVDLQHKMAQHKQAMKDLVRAEGAPMSESEMEAVKLLGRLERSQVRARNYEEVDGEED
ncbi:hypothetical protein HYH03_013974 [Edaphochlamys debaryana]|uniref:Uncharacterized protein n=1 Tax=Edaphochlamys debaryana TaxID=47281 RepID=A0A836BSM6_9CHLO|nr:hypothetical protein HYH03_013974 [Edaphochlamys debaryana]|eukprot:KAG2487405.1 hypothetical protein HYH03_013974 [Edaphochlamys debaryana]